MEFKHIQQFSFFILLLGVSLAFVWLLSPYIMPVFWAFVLALLFFPFNEKLVYLFKGKRALASSFTLFFIILILLVPLSLLLSVFISELKVLYSYTSGNEYKSSVIIESLQNNLNSLGFLHVDLQSTMDKLLHKTQQYSGSATSFALGIGKTSLDFAVKFVVMFYILFFFLRDGAKWVKKIAHALPLGKNKEFYLFAKMSEMIRAVFKGSFVIAFVQGVLGALLFWFVGIPSPVVWGAFMMLLAFIPAIGPALIWAPAALVMFFLGDLRSALIILGGGILVIGTVDNLLRPYLLSKNTTMPDLLIFISVLGGISLFGMAGLIIGPVIAAAFLSTWELFEKEYKEELDTQG